MIFRMLFPQYRNQDDERWFGSKWMSWHGRKLLGDPKDMGLEDVPQAMLERFYDDKVDRFSHPEDIGMDIIEYRQANFKQSCLREASRKVVSFAVFPPGVILVCLFVGLGHFGSWKPSGGSMASAVKWAFTGHEAQLAICEDAEKSAGYEEACHEVREEKSKRQQEVAEQEKKKETAEARSSLKDCFKFDTTYRKKVAEGYVATDEDTQYLETCNALARQYPDVVSELQE